MGRLVGRLRSGGPGGARALQHRTGSTCSFACWGQRWDGDAEAICGRDRHRCHTGHPAQVVLSRAPEEGLSHGDSRVGRTVQAPSA